MFDPLANVANEPLEDNHQSIADDDLERLLQPFSKHLINGVATPDEPLYSHFIKRIEKPFLKQLMRHTAGNQSTAARLSGLSRGTLRKKLKAHGIDE